MKYLIKTPEDEQKPLEDILADEEINVVFRAKHIPYIAVETQLPPDELRAKYPHYEINEEADYDATRPDTTTRGPTEYPC